MYKRKLASLALALPLSMLAATPAYAADGDTRAPQQAIPLPLDQGLLGGLLSPIQNNDLLGILPSTLN